MQIQGEGAIEQQQQQQLVAAAAALQHPHHNTPIAPAPQARLLYHEAAGAISPSTVGADSSRQRIQLLSEAYELAAAATSLAPASLSCASLRAMLAINLLVEESACLGPSAAAATTPSSSSGKGGKGGKGKLPQQHAGGSSRSSSSSSSSAVTTATSAQLDTKCRELMSRFLGSIEACRAALEHPASLLQEPVITLSTATHTTCDPCSLVSGGVRGWVVARSSACM
jgi:hypothetical protein